MCIRDRSTTSKKYSCVDKDQSKSPKKKYFEQNAVPATAQKNRTTKNWVEEDLNKSPKKTLGDLEPVYDLFTIMGEIIPSESLSRVA